MTYVRIKPPKNKGQSVPQSISTGGVKVVVGGPGVEVKDGSVISRIKKIGGKHIETAKTTFRVEAPKGGIIDMSAGEMKAQPEEETGEEASGKNKG